MANIPSLEEMLSQIRQCIGLKRHPQEKRFSDFKLSFENHTKMSRTILDEIFTALNMDDMDCKGAITSFMELANFQKGLELNIWTGNASQQQVLWHLLAYSYAPGLARRLAFWSIANTKYISRPIDAGMPGGKFWFLPHRNKKNNKLEMPITQVINWLLDLLGDVTVDSLKGSLGNEKLREQGESAIRTLYNWRKNGLPKSAKKIDELFPDDVNLSFAGTLSKNDALTLDEKLDAAINLVKKKNLANAEDLHDEIPMTELRLKAIFSGNASDAEKAAFIEQVATRYQIPTMSTIRKRLKVARMMQDGYKRLLAFLCPNVAEDCTDPVQNKLLQIIGLFSTVYNLTLDASENADSEREQDAWFESKLAPWDEDLMRSILPFKYKTGYLLVAERLARIFMNLEPNSPLEDLIPWDKDNAAPIIERRLLIIKQQYDEDVRLKKLDERVRISSPWRALSMEDNFWVLSLLAGQDDISLKTQEMILKRMRNLAETDGEKVSVNIIELGYLLNGEPKNRTKNIIQRVQHLIDESEQSAGYSEWKAPLLQLRAKHHLFQNDFTAALKDFKASLDACSERGFGSLRGEIARDSFATDLAENGFVPQNHEIYYRNMLGYMEFPNGMPSFEDIATECEDFFWDNLYQPYSDVERIVGKSMLQYEEIINEILGLINEEDWEGLRAWLLKNAKKLRNRSIKEARRNSVLLSWIKFLNSQEQVLPQLRVRTPLYLQSETLKFEELMKNWRKAITILLEVWPEQAKIADWKGQTPLMLIADKGDIKLTKLLTPLSDVNTQDYMGRTALHSAISGRSSECVSMILESDNIDELKVTVEGNTALHMAVRFGLPKIVDLILEECPALSTQQNHINQAPLDMAQDMLDHYSSWQDFLRKENRQVGSKDDFTNIIFVLSRFSD